MRDIADLRQNDRLGRDWSKKAYRDGYTSYGSVCDLHLRYPSFERLVKSLEGPLADFARANQWKTRGMGWQLTACWVNVMGKSCYHTSHNHPHSTVSGAYYISSPPGSVALKIEDPRLALLMSAPPREVYEAVKPMEGGYVLFESWLRHEVPPNTSKRPRISVSFNWSLERTTS